MGRKLSGSQRSQTAMTEIKALATMNPDDVPQAARSLYAQMPALSSADAEGLAKAALEHLRRRSFSATQVLLSLLEDVFTNSPADITGGFMGSAGFVAVFDDLLENCHIDQDDAVEYHLIQTHLLTVMDYGVDSDEGKRVAAKTWLHFLLSATQLTPMRPYEIPRMALSVLMNIVKGNAANKNLLAPHLGRLLEYIVKGTHDFYLQVQIIELAFRVVHGSEMRLSDIFAPSSSEGRLLKDGIAALTPSSDHLLNDIVALLEKYNKVNKPSNIILIDSQMVTLGTLQLQKQTVFFGKTLILLAWNNADLTVPYNLVRSIKIARRTCLVFRLDNVPPDCLRRWGLEPSEQMPELLLELTEEQFTIVKKSDIKDWIQKEQQKKGAPAGITQKSAIPPKPKQSAPLRVSAVAKDEPPPRAVDVGAYLASSLESQPLALPLQQQGQEPPPPHSAAKTPMRPAPGSLKKAPSATHSKSSSKKPSVSAKKRGREELEQPLMMQDDDDDNDKVARVLEQPPSSVRQSFAAPQAPPPPPVFNFNFGGRTTGVSGGDGTTSPINFSQLEQETPRGDDDFELILSQLRRVMSDTVSKKKHESLSVLTTAMQGLQAELDAVKRRTEELRTQYTTTVREEIAKLRNQEQQMKDKMTTAVQRLNDDIGRIMQQTGIVSDHITALEIEYVQAAGGMRQEEDLNLRTLKAQVEQHMKAMEDKISDLVSTTHPLKFLTTYISKKMAESTQD